MRFGLDPHLLGLFLGQAARCGNGDLLLLVRGLVLRGHVQDAVGVDVKGDLDLRHPALSWRNPVQLELAQRTVVRGELALALHDVNLHARLVVRGGRVRLHLARRNRRVARDLHGHHPAQRLHTQRKRRHVQQQDVLHFARQDRALNRRAYRHDFVGVHALVQFLLPEERAHQLLHLWNARRAANHYNFLDVVRRHLRVFQRLLHRFH